MRRLTVQRSLALLILSLASIIMAACAPLTAIPGTAPTATPRLPQPAVNPAASPDLLPAPGAAIAPVEGPGCLSQPGNRLSFTLEEPRLAQIMRVIVYTPPCYAQTGDRYPVLYLLHGVGYTEDQWLRLGIAETADRLIANGEITPFIIVMPFNYGSDPPASDPFDEVLLETLIPVIDTDFFTQPERTLRAVGGLSRGGGWAIHLGVRHPAVFGISGAHSPAIFYADGATMKMRLQQIPPELRPRFYIDIGDADQDLKAVREFESVLEELNIEHTWRLNIGAHTEDYWRGHIENYLRWYSLQFSGSQ